MNTNYKDRLDALEQQLRERGVVDIKFDIDWMNKPTHEEIIEDVISTLEAMLRGETRPYEPKELSFNKQ